MRKYVLSMMLAMLLTITLIQRAEAADFNINLRFYAVNGVMTGEFSCGEEVAFRLQVGPENVLPVMTMQRGMQTNILSPEIVNGMFLVRFRKE